MNYIFVHLLDNEVF